MRVISENHKLPQNDFQSGTCTATGFRIATSKLFFIAGLLLVFGSFAQNSLAQKTFQKKKNKPATAIKPAKPPPFRLDGLTTEMEQDSGMLVNYFRTHFSEADQRVETIYDWLTHGLQYDQRGIYDFEKKELSIPEILSRRQGVCQDVATLFNFLCTRTGIENYVVSGFTTNNASVGHAWNICMYKGKLHLFDATWDLGDTSTGKNPGKQFFSTNPLIFNQGHFPFHPMWQLVGRPITAKEYVDGQFDRMKLEGNYHYADTIRLFSGLTRQQQDSFYLKWFSTQRLVNYASMQEARSYKNQVKHNEFEKLEVGYTELNNAVEEFNDYIVFFNKRYQPKKEDSYFTGLILRMDRHIHESGKNFESVQWEYFEKDDAIDRRSRFEKLFKPLSNRWRKHKAFIELYLSKKTLGRTFIFSNPANNPEN